MKRISRLILIGAFALFALTTACNLPALPPSATSAAAGQATSTPISIDVSSQTPTPAPAIPITGLDVVSLQCQFCVNDEAHAVLIMSNQAFFNVADPGSGVTCLSAQEVNGRRILLCRGAQQASFTLNVCVDNANCLEFPITLQPCPLIGSGTSTTTPFAPILLTPISSSSTSIHRNTVVPPATGISPTATIETTAVTPVTGPTETEIVPVPSPIPTVVTEPPPPPPTEPSPIPEPNDTPEPERTRRPTHTPRN